MNELLPWKPRLVLIDDDPADRNLVQRALRNVSLDVELLQAGGGAEALDLLRLKPTARPWRTLVLLDLNLSGEDGRQVLRTLEAEGRLAELAVVVFTSSRLPADIAECYRLGAKSFFRKPGDFAQLVDAMKAILRYWFELMELPSSSSPR